MNNRIPIIDILRGLALFGVMVVNAAAINGPYFLNAIDFAFEFNIYDNIVSEIISLVFLEKSYPIFVFLFGLGTQLLLKSLQNKNQTTNRAHILSIFAKRMLVLGIFGVLHGALFYWGDVLLMYAILGFIAGTLLIFVFNNDYKRLLKFNILLIMASMMINISIYKLVANDPSHNSLDAHYVETTSSPMNLAHSRPIHIKKDIENINNNNIYNHLYQNGTVKNIIFNNINSYFNSYFYGVYGPTDLIIALNNINYLIEVFIFMLFGAMTVLVPIWQDKNITLSNKFILKAITIFGTVFVVSEILIANDSLTSMWLDYMDIILMMNNVALYLLLFLYVYNKISSKERYKKSLASFAALGSMTLTWYLLQSVLMGMLLYNYGFGLYGKVGVGDCFLFAVIYYYFCYKVSPIWLRKFKQGPVEKLWRLITLPNNPPQNKEVIIPQ